MKMSEIEINYPLTDTEHSRKLDSFRVLLAELGMNVCMKVLADMLLDREIDDSKIPTVGCEYDNHGQILYYTGIYKWADGSFHDEEEISSFDDDLDALLSKMSFSKRV